MFLQPYHCDMYNASEIFPNSLLAVTDMDCQQGDMDSHAADSNR